MSLDELDTVLSPTKRLAALGIVNATEEVTFSFIKNQLKLTDSDLSKQMKALLDANYVTTKRTGKGKTRKSWFKVTIKGKIALRSHVRTLNELAKLETS